MYAPPRFTTFDLPEHLVLLARHEASERADCHPRTLDSLISEGRLPVVRLGSRVLVRMSSLDAYLDARRTPPVIRAAPAPGDNALGPFLADRRETAHWLRVSTSALDRWSRAIDNPDQHLPSITVGRRHVRYRASDVAEFIDRHSHPATHGPLAGRIA